MIYNWPLYRTKPHELFTIFWEKIDLVCLMAGNSPWELTLHPPVQDGKQWGVGGCSTPCEWCIEEEQLPCTRQWGWMAPGHGGIRTIWSDGLLGQISSDCFTTSLEIPGTPDTKMLPEHCGVFHKESSETANKTPGETLKAQLSPLLAAFLHCQSSAVSSICGCSLFPCWT